MDGSRKDLLGELARDAALERADFLVRATEQLQKFLEANRTRIDDLGGMVLVDDDPEYLSIAPDLTFRSRSRYLDDDTGQWVSETEVIDSAGELVELYNPADVLAWFTESAREAAGLPPEPTGAEGLRETAGIAIEETVPPEGDRAYADAADEWAAQQEIIGQPADEEEAAERLYDLALVFQERSQRSEARLLEQFQDAAGRLTPKIGDLLVVDDEDERLTLTSEGTFTAEVVPEDAEGTWRRLGTADELVEFYDPTDVFGDVADAIAEAFPSVAEEGEGDEPDEGEDGDEDDGEPGEEPGGDQPKA